MTQTYSGGCQCGKVRYEVQMDIGEVLACNCSRCGRLGSLLAFAPATQFTLLSGDSDLTKFEFNKHTIQHQFCSTCGIQSFALGTNPKTGAKLLLDGKTLASTPKYLTYGASFSIAGGGSVAAVATDESHYIGAKPASLKARSSALTPISGADLHRRSP
jgi:hypothetical protein